MTDASGRPGLRVIGGLLVLFLSYWCFLYGLGWLGVLLPSPGYGLLVDTALLAAASTVIQFLLTVAGSILFLLFLRWRYSHLRRLDPELREDILRGDGGLP